jgi:hypothetical protein
MDCYWNCSTMCGYIFKVWMDRRKMMVTRIEQLESK